MSLQPQPTSLNIHFAYAFCTQIFGELTSQQEQDLLEFQQSSPTLCRDLGEARGIYDDNDKLTDASWLACMVN